MRKADVPSMVWTLNKSPMVRRRHESESDGRIDGHAGFGGSLGSGNGGGVSEAGRAAGALIMKSQNVKTRKHYVADRRQYLSNGKRNTTSGGWLTMYWDEHRRIYMEGCYHHT